ncbi:MAG: hypothetical protein AAF202_04735 [Pseudomonadota bacterium]
MKSAQICRLQTLICLLLMAILQHGSSWGVEPEPSKKSDPLSCFGIMKNTMRVENLPGKWISFEAPQVEELQDRLIADDLKDWGGTDELEWGTFEVEYAKKFVTGFTDGHDEVYEPGTIRVFFSEDEDGLATLPRVAIFYRDGKISEIRGFARHQHLDAEFAASGMLLNELAVLGQDNPLYRMALDAQKLGKIQRKVVAQLDLDLEELSFLYELFRPVEPGFGYRRVEEEDGLREMKVMFSGNNLDYSRHEFLDYILRQRHIRQDLAQLLEVEMSEVVILDPDKPQKEQISKNTKVVFGDYTVESANSDPMPNWIFGDLYVMDEKLVDKILPQVVVGDLHIHATHIQGVRFPQVTRDVSMNVNVPVLIRNSKLPVRAKRLTLRGKMRLENVVMPELLEELWVAEVLVAQLRDSIAAMRVTRSLSILETHDGQARSGRVEGSELADFIIPEIEGAHYHVSPTFLKNVEFPPTAKSVSVSAKHITGVNFPNRVEENFDLELLVRISNSTLPSFVGGSSEIGTVALHHSWNVEIHETPPLKSVQGTYEGLSELAPQR